MQKAIYITLLNMLLSGCSNSKFFTIQPLNEHEVQLVKPLIVPKTFELPAAND